MKILILTILLISTTFAQKSNSFITHKFFKPDEMFIDTNGQAVWFNMQNEHEHCVFAANVLNPYVYDFVYYEAGYPYVGFSMYLIEKNNKWKFDIISYYTEKTINCKEITVEYVNADEIEIKFNCQDNTIPFKSVILNKNFYHLD